MTETKANNFSESRVVFNQLANELLEIRDSCKITAIIIGELKKPTIGEMHRIPEKNGVLISTDQLIKLSQMKNLCFQFYLSSNSKDFQPNKILENVFNNEKHKINFSILKKDNMHYYKIILFFFIIICFISCKTFNEDMMDQKFKELLN
jgi:hypothetical protein